MKVFAYEIAPAYFVLPLVFTYQAITPTIRFYLSTLISYSFLIIYLPLLRFY